MLQVHCQFNCICLSICLLSFLNMLTVFMFFVTTLHTKPLPYHLLASLQLQPVPVLTKVVLHLSFPPGLGSWCFVVFSCMLVPWFKKKKNWFLNLTLGLNYLNKEILRCSKHDAKKDTHKASIMDIIINYQ